MKTAKPNYRKHIFWDTDYNKIDPETHQKYIIKKVLEYGDESDFASLEKNYSKKAIIEVLKNTRGISTKSANFWALIFNIKPNEIKCLQKSYQNIHKNYWSN